MPISARHTFPHAPSRSPRVILRELASEGSPVYPYGALLRRRGVRGPGGSFARGAQDDGGGGHAAPCRRRGVRGPGGSFDRGLRMTVGRGMAPDLPPRVILRELASEGSPTYPYGALLRRRGGCEPGGSFARGAQDDGGGRYSARCRRSGGPLAWGAGRQPLTSCYIASPVSTHGVRVRRSGLAERMSASFRSRRQPLIAFSRAIASSGSPKVS